MEAKVISSGVIHTSLPQSYVRAEGDRPRLSEVSECDDVPIIDLGCPDRALIARQIGDACRYYGFFQVINHGMAEEAVEKMQAVAKEFFDLPVEEKLKLYSDDPSKTMRLSTSFNVKKETVHNWRDYLRLHCYPLEKYAPEWPSNPPSFSTISSSIEDASEDCRVFAELYRRRASDRIIEKHYDAMVAKCARNPLYRSSMDTEMQKAGGGVRMVATLLERKVFLSWHMSGISQSQNSSSGGAGRADAGVVPCTAGVVPGTAGARNSRPATSSSNISIRVESGEAVNVEPAGGSQPSSPESQAIDDPVFSGGIDLESQTYSNHHVEDSSAEYRVTLVHRFLFGNEANTGVAVRNVIQLSGASSYGVVPPLVWIGFLASVFAPLVRRKWSRYATDLSLIGHISTAWWHLVLLSTKYRTEQYSFVNTTLTALFCIVIALTLIRAGR